MIWHKSWREMSVGRREKEKEMTKKLCYYLQYSRGHGKGGRGKGERKRRNYFFSQTIEVRWCTEVRREKKRRKNGKKCFLMLSFVFFFSLSSVLLGGRTKGGGGAVW